MNLPSFKNLTIQSFGLIAVLAVLVLSPGVVQSQEPTPTSTVGNGNRHEQQAHDDKGPTDKHESESNDIGATQTPLDTNPQTNTQQNKNNGDSTDWWMFGATILLVVVGGIQVVLFYWQLRLINNTLDDTKEASSAAKASADATAILGEVWKNTSEMQLRAYVLLKSIKLDVNIGKPIVANIVIKNFGQTPARNVRHECNIGADSWPPTRVPPSLPQQSFTQPLSPTGEISFKKEYYNILDADNFILIQNGHAAIFVYGKITYIDSFGKARTTNYKLFAGGPIGDDFSKGNMTAYEDGNDYS